MSALGTGFLQGVAGVLTNPLFAVPVGVALGALMHLGSRRSFSWITPEAPERGLALAALALFGRLAGATAVLFVYDRIAPGGIAAFGLSFAATFIALFTVELVRYAGLNRYARPTRARG